MIHQSGGVIAAAYFYQQAPRDGSMISLFPETLAHTQMLEPEVGKWKVQEMTYIGSFAPVNAAFVVRKGAPVFEYLNYKPTSDGRTPVNPVSIVLPAETGAYEIRDGQARWIPALDTTRIVIVAMIVIAILLRRRN